MPTARNAKNEMVAAINGHWTAFSPEPWPSDRGENVRDELEYDWLFEEVGSKNGYLTSHPKSFNIMIAVAQCWLTTV